MKFNKRFSVLACMAATVVGLSSCSEVTDPKYHEPDASTFQIYAPAFQNEYYQLAPGETFDLVLNGQPDYGFSAITQYRAEVSLTEDFANYQTLIPTGSGTLSRMTLNQEDLALALCKLDGVETADDYVDKPARKVYFRGAAFIDGIADSYVHTSNVTYLSRVKGYLALPVPGKIYVIGNYVGAWIGPTTDNIEALAPYTLKEKDDDVDSKVYYGSILFQPTNESEGCIFRFYTALGSWDENTYGCSGGTDSDTPVEFPDFGAGQTLNHGLAKTKDSFCLKNYTGMLDFVVDLSDAANPKVTITAPAQ